MGKPIPKPGRGPTEQIYVPAVVEGLGITMKHFFRNAFGRRRDTVTVEYVGADGPRSAYPERFRGMHRLTQRDDGSPRCVACLCCSTACPAQCIFIEPGEYPEGDPRFGFERYPVRFMIDELRCVFCGYCAEACPCDAIRLDTGVYVPPEYGRTIFLYDKERLLSHAGRKGTHGTENPRQDPPSFEKSYARGRASGS